MGHIYNKYDMLSRLLDKWDMQEAFVYPDDTNDPTWRDSEGITANTLLNGLTLYYYYRCQEVQTYLNFNSL